MKSVPNIRRVILITLILICAAGSSFAAKNVILMIGDGMGRQHVNAGSYYAYGEEGRLAFEQFYRCDVVTCCLGGGVTDSAAAATALATGHKAANGTISQTPNGTPYKTALEVATDTGRSTGLVTTVPITDATPAGFGAHQPSRKNRIDIANDYLTASKPNVLMGGGDPKRGVVGWFSTEQIDLARNNGYQVVFDNSQLSALDLASTTHVLGLFAGYDMTYEVDRKPDCNEPRLSQMATTALNMLARDPDGFFLMIEGGMIDHAAHDNQIERVTGEVVEFSNTVKLVLDWMRGRDDTLLIVTADHETGGLTATNNGAGNYPTASWASKGHTMADVPFYITGAEAKLADAYVVNNRIDNTDVHRILFDALNAQSAK